MGPGCMINAPGFKSDSLRLFKPNTFAYSEIDGKCNELWRSCCMRNNITTSASETAVSKS
ncbi:unknown [Coraliomargarita sp. CAG:312]|nr:unknown [Coraliomargarita sp. CAG:312]